MAGEHEELCRAIDEELAAFLRCIDNYETASREVSLCPRAPRAGFAQRARRARCCVSQHCVCCADRVGVQVGGVRPCARAKVYGAQRLCCVAAAVPGTHEGGR